VLDDLFDRAIQLLAAADKDIGMLFDVHPLELRERCLGDGIERLARRIGEQVDVEIVTHKFMLRLYTDQRSLAEKYPYPLTDVRRIRTLPEVSPAQVLFCRLTPHAKTLESKALPA
jgi:hypothetical protein